MMEFRTADGIPTAALDWWAPCVRVLKNIGDRTAWGVLLTIERGVCRFAEGPLAPWTKELRVGDISPGDAVSIEFLADDETTLVKATSRDRPIEEVTP